MQLRSPIPSLNQPKNKKVYSKKKSLYFRKRKFLALILKTAYIFSKKSFSYIFWKKSFSYIFSKYFRKWIPALFDHNFQNFFPKRCLIFFPKNPRSEEIYYIFSKESFSYFSRNGSLHFSVQAWRIKNSLPGENILPFRKLKPWKNFLHFSKRKLFLCFRK